MFWNKKKKTDKVKVKEINIQEQSDELGKALVGTINLYSKTHKLGKKEMEKIILITISTLISENFGNYRTEDDDNNNNKPNYFG